ncbi:MAG: hypothetical protein ACK4F9_00305 [Brevinematia bacterium]
MGEFAIKIFENDKEFIIAIVIIPALLIGIIGLIFGDGVREVFIRNNKPRRTN